MSNFFSNGTFTLSSPDNVAGNTYNIAFTSTSNANVVFDFNNYSYSSDTAATGLALNIVIRPRLGQIYPRVS